MKQFNIKVLLQVDGVVFRDILISESYTLKDLHLFIIDSFGFEGQQMASFLISDGGFQATDEIPLEKLGENDKRLMDEVLLADIFKSEGDQLTYIYDYINEWRFELEVIEISNSSKSEIQLIKSVGRAPKESERDLSGSDAESILMNAILGDEFDLDEEDDLFDSDDFESLDDYEEYQ